MRQDFYVYAYLREDKHSPYYVGKGCHNRINQKHGKRITLPPTERRVRVAENLTEEEAFTLEKLLILMWGRESEGGVLLNLQEGGKQPPSVKGKTWKLKPFTEGHRRKLSLAQTGKTAWNKGKKGAQSHSAETRQKCSAAGKKKVRGKRVEFQGVVYPSASALSRAISVPVSTLLGKRGWGEQGKIKFV